MLAFYYTITYLIEMKENNCLNSSPIPCTRSITLRVHWESSTEGKDPDTRKPWPNMTKALFLRAPTDTWKPIDHTSRLHWYLCSRSNVGKLFSFSLPSEMTKVRGSIQDWRPPLNFSVKANFIRANINVVKRCYKKDGRELDCWQKNQGLNTWRNYPTYLSHHQN